MNRRAFFQRMVGGAALVATTRFIPTTTQDTDSNRVISIDKLVVYGKGKNGEQVVSEHGIYPINLHEGDSLQTTWSYKL